MDNQGGRKRPHFVCSFPFQIAHHLQRAPAWFPQQYSHHYHGIQAHCSTTMRQVIYRLPLKMGWVLYFRQHKWTKAAMTHNPLLKCQNKRLDFFFPTMTSVHHPGEGKKLKPISNDLSRINRRFFLQRICTMDGLTDSSLEKIMGRQITLSNAFLLTVSFLNVPLLAPPLPTFAWEMLFCFTF